MKKNHTWVAVFFTVILLNNSNGQNNNTIILNSGVQNPDGLVSVVQDNSGKILSGLLVRDISRKRITYQENIQNSPQSEISVPTETVAIYMETTPSADEISQLEAQNVKCYPESWIPALPNHPLGFFLAKMPVDKLNETLSFGFVKKLSTAEEQCQPQNNNASIAINSDDVWLAGYDGTGVKVAVLDSGVDTSYAGTELPATFEKRDYSDYPTSTDPNVANITSGHGTHVTGSVLAQGYYSNGRADEGNGTGAFKGSAPGADLVFLKIGGDASSSATSSAMIGAMQAAVNTYSADILSMSYGGWYDHHDGSSTTEQTVDWVYSQGKPFFISAGNSGDDDFHYSGTVNASSETGYIELSAEAGSYLIFNLVWYDGLGTSNDLYLEYYDSGYNLLSVTQYSRTESSRGTESKYSEYETQIASAGTYYLKVVNNSSNSQFFHIYFYDSGNNVTFASPDPYYTIGQPASADDAFAVGAYTSRYSFITYDGAGPYHYTGANPLDEIAIFSSRGPRVNGGVTKPNITAPGTIIISLRDQDVYSAPSTSWVDDDGTTNVGDAHYYVMQGTSMACPIAAGAATLLLQKEPAATPQNIYDAIENTAASNGYTSTLPNDTWGNGILDILAASNSSLLPVELASFSAVAGNQKVQLSWSTATEVNNYGFNIERKIVPNLQGFKNLEGFTKIGFIKGAGNSNSSLSYSFIDKNPVSGKCIYRLKQIDVDGSASYSNEIEVTLTLPVEFKLAQNYPNPFNPTTNIKFSIPEKSNVTLNIFNTLGQKVASLLNKEMNAGNHSASFDASQLTSGVYFYRLETDKGNLAVKKMMLVK